MDRAQNLADRVAVIAGGVIVAEGTPDTLGGRATAASIVRFRMIDVDAAELPVDPATLRVEAGGSIEISTSMRHECCTHLRPGRSTGTSSSSGLTVDRPTLEDVYLDLAGERGGDD